MDNDRTMKEGTMYFDAMTSLLRAFLGIFDNLSDTINTRGTIYHRGTFYADLAKAIRLLLEMRVSPFIESEYNWSWWADQCEERAAALGNDATFAMHLPDPLPAGEYLGYPALTNHLDKLTAFMTSVYQQEMDDADITDLGKVTPAECVKICHRFVHYWLGKRLGTYERGYIKPWLWIAKVSSELRWMYQQLGEPDRAGSSGTPGGPMPPISWPGN